MTGTSTKITIKKLEDHFGMSPFQVSQRNMKEYYKEALEAIANGDWNQVHRSDKRVLLRYGLIKKFQSQNKTS